MTTLNTAILSRDTSTVEQQQQISQINLNLSQTFSNRNNNVQLKDWNVSYDGVGSVSDFLFKI